MKGSTHAMLAAAAIMVLSGVTGQVRDAWARAGMESAQMVSGKISAVDPLQRIVKVKTGLFASETFVVHPDTKISDGRNPLSLEQLERGDQAVVEYRQQEGKQVAQTIIIESGAKPSSNLPASPMTPRPSEPPVPSEPAAPDQASESIVR